MSKRIFEHTPVPRPLLYKATNMLVFGAYFKMHGGISYCGKENLKSVDDKSYILASVHRSWDDPAVIANPLYKATKNQAHFMAKKEIWERNRLAGWFIESTGAFPVDRSGHGLNNKTSQYIDKLVDGGAIIGIFPEGTRMEGNEVKREQLKIGVGILAVKYGIPIIPVGLSGTEQTDRGPIHVEFGAPIYPSPFEADNIRGMLPFAKQTLNALHNQMQITQDLAASHRGAVTRR